MNEIVEQIIKLQKEASLAHVRVHEKYAELAEQLDLELGMKAIIRVQYNAMKEKIYICADEFDSQMASILESYDLEWDVIWKQDQFIVRCWHSVTLEMEVKQDAEGSYTGTLRA